MNENAAGAGAATGAVAAPASGGRRTQRERKRATVSRLMDATISAIAEVGYAGTSIGEVCRRSGVSRGGLFRHFDSRLDLVIAAAEEVAARHLATARAWLGGHGGGLREALPMMRERHRDEINIVWFELAVAARSDAGLRDRLAPVADRFYRAISDLGRHVPELAALSDRDRHLLISTVRDLFDGETISRALVPEPGVEADRLTLIAEFAEFFIARRT
ncbi:TetR/AcrR family transcriptional regulator [Spirillospora albida]|uniref:TetR/AcrR family transcriptional regulator n=1 Tax=Spirillospora albida TaxID=58123 RepID=UPI00068A5298|nr:TetR/AcrR family transcriptional regulator [Spirillospora albida]